MIMNNTEIVEITKYINAYRSKHGSPMLIYNPKIANNSQAWSDYLMHTNRFEHSNNYTYGENLYFSYGSPLSKINQIKNSIDNWYSEIANYDFTSNTHQTGTGHFTSLIWKASTEFGIGITMTKSKCIICLNTNPVGNIGGLYKINVQQILK